MGTERRPTDLCPREKTDVAWAAAFSFTVSLYSGTLPQLLWPESPWGPDASHLQEPLGYLSSSLSSPFERRGSRGPGISPSS